MVIRRGGPRHGPPPPPTLGRAPAQPWRASALALGVSSRAPQTDVSPPVDRALLARIDDRGRPLVLDERRPRHDLPGRERGAVDARQRHLAGLGKERGLLAGG